MTAASRSIPPHERPLTPATSTDASSPQEPDCFNQYAVLSDAGGSTAIYSNSLPEPSLIEERKVSRQSCWAGGTAALDGCGWCPVGFVALRSTYAGWDSDRRAWLNL